MVDLDDARSLAARVAAFADLQDVRLFDMHGSLGSLPPDRPGGLGYRFDTDIEVQVPADDALIVSGSYQLTVFFHSHDEAEPQADADHEDDEPPVVDLKFQLAALYELVGHDAETAFPEHELDAFGQTTGLLTLHPYAREFISDMTGRMGLPPLHLGTVRVSLDKRNDEHGD